MKLELLPGLHAVCRLPMTREIPAWATGPLVNLTLTPDECTLVTAQSGLPDGVTAEPDWRVFRVAGVLEFDLVGIIARISDCLANAGVSLFVASTFLTDYFLVRQVDLYTAIDALRGSEYEIAEISL